MSAISYYEEVAAAADFVRGQSKTSPAIAVILGSGLGDFASTVENATSIPYDRIPKWPAAKVVGHEARLVTGEIAGHPVAVLAGRAQSKSGHSDGKLGQLAFEDWRDDPAISLRNDHLEHGLTKTKSQRS